MLTVPGCAPSLSHQEPCSNRNHMNNNNRGFAHNEPGFPEGFFPALPRGQSNYVQFADWQIASFSLARKHIE
jgi:hypothetical protein